MLKKATVFSRDSGGRSGWWTMAVWPINHSLISRTGERRDADRVGIPAEKHHSRTPSGVV